MRILHKDHNPVIAGMTLLDRNLKAFEPHKHANLTINNHYLYSREAADLVAAGINPADRDVVYFNTFGITARSVEKQLVDLTGNSKKRMPLTEYLCRYPSTFLTKHLWLPLGLKATTVCLLSLFLFMIAAVLINFQHNILGVIVATLAFILDCCDGEVARVKLENNAYGGWLDSTYDRVSEFFIVLAMLSNTTNIIAASIAMTALFGIFMINLTGAYVPERFRTNKHPTGGVPAWHKSIDWLDYGRSTYLFVLLFFVLINQHVLGLIFLAVTTNFYWTPRVHSYKQKLNT